MPQAGCIIIDYHLSGLDSLTLVSELRRLGVNTSILIYTALSDRTLEQRVDELGIKQIVDKSSDVGELLDAIRRHGS
jgi:DNA-binding NarL/FixJ family response regulator